MYTILFLYVVNACCIGPDFSHCKMLVQGRTSIVPLEVCGPPFKILPKCSLVLRKTTCLMSQVNCINSQIPTCTISTDSNLFQTCVTIHRHAPAAIKEHKQKLVMGIKKGGIRNSNVKPEGFEFMSRQSKKFWKMSLLLAGGHCTYLGKLL